MTRRTPEQVLRDEIRDAKAALDAVAKQETAAAEAALAAERRLKACGAGREAAQRRVARAEAALAALVPLPGAEEEPEA